MSPSLTIFSTAAVNDMKTVIVIGGGASGIMAALTAAEDKNNKVLLIERQQRIGRKLLSTGNGRCNLTNTGASTADYHGASESFVASAFELFDVNDTLRYFSDLGLVTVTEYGGRVYPLSNSANSVLDVLRFALERSGVEVMTSTTVQSIAKKGRSFAVSTETQPLSSDYLIVACGGAAGAKLGGTTLGYELLRPLGHRRTSLHPALVQLITDPTYPRALKGVRADAALTLYDGGNVVAHSCGELQFTETGLSGPAAFDISREAAFISRGGEVHIDFLRSYSHEEVLSLLRKKRELNRGLEASELLTGIVHNRLGKMLIKYSDIGGGRKTETLTDTELEAVASACTDMVLPLCGVGDFNAAQVTAGGIQTAEISPLTMESKLVKGLFVCGELLDVDGNCGGFNLQWAWTSGRIAGRLGK